MTAGEQQHRIEEKNAAKTAHRTHKIGSVLLFAED